MDFNVLTGKFCLFRIRLILCVLFKVIIKFSLGGFNAVMMSWVLFPVTYITSDKLLQTWDFVFTTVVLHFGHVHEYWNDLFSLRLPRHRFKNNCVQMDPNNSTDCSSCSRPIGDAWNSPVKGETEHNKMKMASARKPESFVKLLLRLTHRWHKHVVHHCRCGYEM